ncbi:hypothetical protein ACWEPC_29775 [Nonomuraea sp. NPDC004297]
MRGLWLLAGSVVTVVALTLSTLGLWHSFARASTPTEHTMRSIPFEGQKVRIAVGRGQVSLWIVSGPAGKVHVQRVLRWSRHRPTVTEDWGAASATLRLDATCPGSDQPTGPVCEADYIVAVPPETAVEAGTSGGPLFVEELFGDLRLTSVSGNVRVRAVAGDLYARIGTGSFDGDDLGGERADVEVGSGDVRLTFHKKPSDVRAVVRTKGDVMVAVPPSPYDVTAEGANTSIDLRQSPGASRRITASAPDGIVTLCCR